LNISPLDIIKEEAFKKGFIGIGFSKAENPPFLNNFKTWIKEGRHAEMKWLERNAKIRQNPGLLLENCRTIISLAYPYSWKKPSTPDGFTAARFTEPRKDDYHVRLKSLVETVVRKLQPIYPESKWRICVDSAPILERSFAYKAGIGFIGKNNMLIIPGYGSFLYLAEILTTASIPGMNSIQIQNQCGECSLCLDACPNGALEGPFRLNSEKCLSYMTIEYKGDVSPATGAVMGECFFGCDICQEACPHNGKTKEREISLPSSKDILKMAKGAFKKYFGNTSFSRSGLKKIKSNLNAVKNNPF
jgi:epoxyqueuosine reductase